MKSFILILALLALTLLVMPASTSGRESGPGDGGFDPCRACIYVPAWCGLCLVQQWWNDQWDCFPWWPDCM